MEDIPLDLESGAPLALNLQDFKFPTLADLPSIEPVLIERDDPFGPYGAKALGEPPLVPVAAAIANAVCDATGVRIRDLPITAEKVLRGLNK
jgi:CO/xanthine dehydrogenase Mo-binding subunit